MCVCFVIVQVSTYVCVTSKAACLINDFHLVQENSLLTFVLSSLLRRETAFAPCLFEYIKEGDEGRIKKILI